MVRFKKNSIFGIEYLDKKSQLLLLNIYPDNPFVFLILIVKPLFNLL